MTLKEIVISIISGTAVLCIGYWIVGLNLPYPWDVFTIMIVSILALAAILNLAQRLP